MSGFECGECDGDRGCIRGVIAPAVALQRLVGWLLRTFGSMPLDIGYDPRTFCKISVV